MYLQTILGSGGTIGSFLPGELKHYTSRIRLVSRYPKKINESDEIMAGDLTNPETVDAAVAGSDVVYLVVGLDYDLKIWEEKWPGLMKATIDACIRHGARLVFFDNVYMYDINSIPHMTETSPMNPASAKGAVKKRLVQMIMDNVKSGRLMALIARSADFYGPGKGKIMFNQMIADRVIKGKKAMWLISDTKKHSFTFTLDAAKATALLGNTNDAYNQVWHLPTDQNTFSISEIVDLFAKEVDSESAGGVTVIPSWLLKMMGLFSPVMREINEMVYQYDRDYFFDSSKFVKRFGFKPTTYPEGIRMMVRGNVNHPDYAGKNIVLP